MKKHSSFLSPHSGGDRVGTHRALYAGAQSHRLVGWYLHGRLASHSQLNAVTANQNVASLPQSQCKSFSSDSQQVVPLPTWITLELNRKANSQVPPQTSASHTLGGSSHLRFKEPSRQCCCPSQSYRVCHLEDHWLEGRRQGGA